MNRIDQMVYRMRRSEHGFSLIELMIVVAVIAILTLIAYPNYINSIREGKRGQAKADLLNDANSMERCFTQTNTYVGCTVTQTTSVTNGSVNYDISLVAAATAQAYTLQAVPHAGSDQVNDRCKTLTLTQAGVRGPTTQIGGQACF